MKNKITVLPAMLFCLTASIAQVQVSKEPLHKKDLENKYIRLLNVWLQPGDTTLFPIHSTPSVFPQFTNTTIGTQVKGAGWVLEQSVAGKASYRSFSPDTLVHRVSNWDTIPFHVTDIEILSAYKPTTQLKPLPCTVLFENEKVVAYQLTGSSFNSLIVNGRGPMIAELAGGDEVIYHDTLNKKSAKIHAGKYLYIEPGASFYFTTNGKKEINMVLFEIK